jgi:uncharacterized membrane-anchored protein
MSTLERTLDEAVAAGILPHDFSRPVPDERPWPVVLLTALGAWLAAVPLISMFGLLLGDLIYRGAGIYVVGILLLGTAMVVLRARTPLFVEQLAVPAILVAFGSLGLGLFRDLPDRAASALLACVVIAAAFAIPRPWLRLLLGAAAAVLVAAALIPEHALVDDIGLGGRNAIWIAMHATLALWLGGLWLQHTFCNAGRAAMRGAAIESIAAGWMLSLLAGYALTSGMTMLVGASAGGGFGDPVFAAALISNIMQVLSAALAVLAAGVAARAWPSLRHPALLAVAAVLAILAWFLPALGPVLLTLAVTATTRRFRLATAAAVSAAWIIGSFYYQLHWELASKAVVLSLAGALLGALAWWARGNAPVLNVEAQAPAGRVRASAALIAACAVATLAVANLSIWQKENLIANGERVFVALGPVDPRSLMQGDFMRLNFTIPINLHQHAVELRKRTRPRVVAQRDARGIASILRLHNEDVPLAGGEFLIELTPRDGAWVFVTDAWHFREGDGQRWEAARFGEFRVDARGKALLVGMADEALQPIPR